MHEGKVVIVTGSAGGIGRYVAKTFAQERARVVVCDIKPLDNVSRDLEALEADFLAVPADVTDVKSVQNLVDTVMERYGRIDVLDNNAAIVTHFQWGTGVWPRIAELDPSFWDTVVRTNLGGTFNCTRFVLPHMEAQRSGHIINMMGGSNAVGGSPYQVSKTAIAQFTHHIALEERD
jgi:NAD(P)-dependent dehydrogenase (short-subunit alcohol dehydrogenase family)